MICEYLVVVSELLRSSSATLEHYCYSFNEISFDDGLAISSKNECLKFELLNERFIWSILAKAIQKKVKVYYCLIFEVNSGAS